MGTRVAASRDGEWLAATVPMQDIQLWNVREGKLVTTLPVVEGEIWDLAWSPDGNHLGVGLSDGSVAIWNIPVVRGQVATLGLEW